MDAVIVATPAPVREPVQLAIQLGRPVFCENPLATTRDIARLIVEEYECRGSQYPCTVNEQWLFLPGVRILKKFVDRGDIGQPYKVVIGGKGRDAFTELMRIGSHLLSVAIHCFTGRVLSCISSAPRMRGGPLSSDVAILTATLETETIPIEVDLWPLGYDVRRCFIEVHGTEGRVHASGGFLERVYHGSAPYDAALGSGHDFTWRMIEVPGVWGIGPGMEPRALADPAMNPTFWLLGEFIKLVRGEEVENPYPPQKFLPVTEAMDLIARSAGAQRRVQVGQLY